MRCVAPEEPHVRRRCLTGERGLNVMREGKYEVARRASFWPQVPARNALVLVLVALSLAFAAAPIADDASASYACEFLEGYVPVDVAVRADGVMFVALASRVEVNSGAVFRIDEDGTCVWVGSAHFGIDVDEFGAPCGVEFRIRAPAGDWFLPPAYVRCYPQADSWGPRALSDRGWSRESIVLVQVPGSLSGVNANTFGVHYSAGVYWAGVWYRTSREDHPGPTGAVETPLTNAYLVGVREIAGREGVDELQMRRVVPAEVTQRIEVTPWAPHYITSLEDGTLVVSALLTPWFASWHSPKGEVMTTSGPGALLLVSVAGDVRVLSEEFVYPSGVLVVDGVIYVADRVTGEIHRHAVSGERLCSFGGLDEPMGLARLPNGDICVAETGAGRVLCLPSYVVDGE